MPGTGKADPSEETKSDQSTPVRLPALLAHFQAVVLATQRQKRSTHARRRRPKPTNAPIINTWSPTAVPPRRAAKAQRRQRQTLVTALCAAIVTTPPPLRQPRPAPGRQSVLHRRHRPRHRHARQQVAPPRASITTHTRISATPATTVCRSLRTSRNHLAPARHAKPTTIRLRLCLCLHPLVVQPSTSTPTAHHHLKPDPR